MTTDTAPPALDLEATSPEVKRYHRQKMGLEVASFVLVLSFIVFMAFRGGLGLDADVRDLVGDGFWVRLIVLGAVYAAMVEVISLPIHFISGFILEHRYELSNQTLKGWATKVVKGWLLAAPLGLMVLLGFYALLRFTGDAWWIWATVGSLLLMLVLGRILPVVILPLFYKVTPLENAELEGRLRRLADGTGLTVQGVYRLGLSAETRKANAALAGLGRSRRVLLGDTLLSEFTPEEIEVVFAHEVGHHVHRHIPKIIVWSVITSAVGFWAIDVALHQMSARLGYASFDDPAALPLVMLVPMIFGFVLSPLQNALSRLFERQSDRYALERTHNPLAYRSAFVKLARMNKADPDPHPLAVFFFEDHPPIRERLAMAALPLPGSPILTQG
jgi:STE24 endopeptidase